VRPEDVLVRVEPFQLDDGRTVISRPASPADILALLRQMGGVEVWWCEEHRRAGNRNACGGRMKVEACPMVLSLIVPLDVLAADTGGET
jgi:hypothetical protein